MRLRPGCHRGRSRAWIGTAHPRSSVPPSCSVLGALLPAVPTRVPWWDLEREPSQLNRWWDDSSLKSYSSKSTTWAAGL